MNDKSEIVKQNNLAFEYIEKLRMAIKLAHALRKR